MIDDDQKIKRIILRVWTFRIQPSDYGKWPKLVPITHLQRDRAYFMGYLRKESPDIPDMLFLPTGECKPNEHEQSPNIEDQICIPQHLL